MTTDRIIAFAAAGASIASAWASISYNQRTAQERHTEILVAIAETRTDSEALKRQLDNIETRLQRLEALRQTGGDR